MHYHHRFVVNASLERVAEFHRQSASMGAITPPPVVVQVHSAPEQLRDGDEMDFTMWLGPLPIRWLAKIETVAGEGFIDRQLRGPFSKWEHRHTFEQIDESTTAVVDDIAAELSRHWVWKVIGWGMWLNLPILFAFRGWQTKRLLENGHTAHQNNRANSSAPS